ncbi:MAG: restriction endonuclease [Acidimicrobiales bacterium]
MTDSLSRAYPLKVVDLGSPLSDVFGNEAVSKLSRSPGVGTLAELLATLPYDYWEPTPRVAIAALQTGYEAVVKGQIVKRTEQYLAPITRTTTTRLDHSGQVVNRTEQYLAPPSISSGPPIPVVVVNDGSAPLLARFIRDNPPGGLYPWEYVAVMGTPVRTGWQEGTRWIVAFQMDDPLVGVIKASEFGLPTPLFDAPAARYRGDEDTHHLVARATSLALEELLPLPEIVALTDGSAVSGATLGAILKAIHSPSTSAERNYGWQHRNWAVETLLKIAELRPLLPQPRLIKSPRDAEIYASEMLAALGFEGVAVTGLGRDGGVDVRGRDVVAQVKLEGVKTDAPRLQALSGIAAHEGRSATFFSLAGYTRAALEWAERVDMALFEFDYDGSVRACSPQAFRLLADAGAQPSADIDPELQRQVEAAIANADDAERGQEPGE